MSTAIEWTDETWNPTVGCDRISPGCAHCYAKTLHDRRHAAVLAGKKLAPQYARPFEELQLKADRLDAPLRWRQPRRVFVNSVSDLFHEAVPFEFIDRVFAVMALGYQHSFQILTKRADRMRSYFTAPDVGVRWLAAIYRHHASHPATDDQAYQEADAERWSREGLPNVWLGVSVENQRFADDRIPQLLQTPAAVRFISAEPLLGPVDVAVPKNVAGRFISPLTGYGWARHAPSTAERTGLRLDWVVVGGESGAGARPFDIAWARSIVRQCQDAGVPVFVKQLGRNIKDRNDAGFEGDTPTSWPMDTTAIDDGCHSSRFQGDPVRLLLKSKKGGDPAEWPADLRIRQFPSEVRA